MFSFDSFRRTTSTSSVPKNNENASPLLHTAKDTRQTTFLQRMTSADSVLRTATPLARPSLGTGPHLSSTFSSILSSSSSIPVPVNSWAMLTLARLQDSEEFDDIVDLLLAQDKAVLLLPVSRPFYQSTIIDREFIHDHTIVYQSNKAQVISLSGIQGTFQRDQFVATGLSSVLSTTDHVQKNKGLDHFDLDPSSITEDQPAYSILASHVQIPLRDQQMINIMLIQKPISKSDVSEWNTRQKEDAHNTTHKLARALADAYVQRYRKNIPRTLTQASATMAEFMQDMTTSLSETDIPAHELEESLDAIEGYVCHALYDSLFCHPEGDEGLEDEALESRIAALNLLDFSLGHLGVVASNASEKAMIEHVVKETGTQLQQLNSITNAKDKLEILVKVHHIIVNAIDALAGDYIQSNVDVVSDGIVYKEEEDENKVKGKDEEEAPKEDISKEEEVSKEEDSDSSHQTLHSAGADILLPLLIFTIVKSNPTKFLSNLKFIQRYRRSSQLTGQASYCLTNMLAAASFLETTNLSGLGLSTDRVYGHLTDLETKDISSSADLNAQPISTSGLKIMSDVMDGSYRMLDGIGRLWQRTTDMDIETAKTLKVPFSKTDSSKPAPPASINALVEDRIEKRGVSKILSDKHPTPSELKDMTSKKHSATAKRNLNDTQWEAFVPSFMESRVGAGEKEKEGASTIKSTTRSDTLQALLQAPSQLIQAVTPKSSPQLRPEGPLSKFMNAKSVDELKIGEVTELLADYKRLAAILKQSNII